MAINHFLKYLMSVNFHFEFTMEGKDTRIRRKDPHT